MAKNQFGKIKVALLRILLLCTLVYIMSFFHAKQSKFKEKLNTVVKSENISSQILFTPRHVLPHCIIIGVKKWGTTALKLMLTSIYPNIPLQDGEAHYFNTFYDKGLKFYKKSLPKMTKPDDIIIDKTPTYYRNIKVPARIKKDSPDSKIILLVCDPVRRTGSDFVHMAARGQKAPKYMLNAKGQLPMETSLDQYLKLEHGSYNTTSPLIADSVYAKNIQRWLSLFHREHILVLNGENLVTDPYKLFRSLENFLGLDHLVKKDTFSKADNGFNCWTSLKGRKCLAGAGNYGRKHPERTPGIRKLTKWLKKYYTPYNEKFFKLIGETFEWKMDTI